MYGHDCKVLALINCMFNIYQNVYVTYVRFAIIYYDILFPIVYVTFIQLE